MPAPSHTLYTLTLFLALSSKDAEKHSSACPSACSDEGPSRGMPATCAVRDHRHHERGRRTPEAATSPASGPIPYTAPTSTWRQGSLRQQHRRALWELAQAATSPDHLDTRDSGGENEPTLWAASILVLF